MMAETWRACVPNYEVSSAGHVRRSSPGRKTYAGRILRPQLLANGYLSVRPTVEGKNAQFYVHDIVAEAFLGPKPPGLHVNHKDGVKTNNAPENLEYVSRNENMAHAANSGLMVRGESHPASKLTEQSVAALRIDRDAGMSFSKLASKYGISIATAFNVAHGNYWRHVV